VLFALLALVLESTVTGPCPEQEGVPPTIRLGLNSQRVLKLPGVVSWRFTNPGVLELKPLNATEWLVVGAAAGSGELQLSREGDAGVVTYRVDVVKMDACGMRIVELEKIFPCGATLELRMLGDRLFLDGEAGSLEEWSATRLTLQKYPSIVVLGRLKPAVIERAFRDANAALAAAGFPKAHFERVGDTVFLEGEVPEGDQRRLEAASAEWKKKLEGALWKPAARDAGP